jgi:regulatory protein
VSESPSFEQALAVGFAHLNRRERTEHEMREHLAARGVSPPLVGRVLDELRDQGYLDDERFARMFVQDRRHLSGWGSERIREGLLKRGIPREVADAAVSQASEGELERALEVLAGRFPEGLTNRQESGRALGVLVRRGFDYDLAVDALTAHRRTSRPAA